MTADGWRRADWLALAAVFGVGIGIRVVLLPTEGFRGDLDQFVGWVHHIATKGLTTLYGGTAAGPVPFGPVMAYIWGLLAAVQPAYATATDASDVGLRMLIKAPASLADLGIAGLAAFALRDRPRWAVIAAAVVLLVPATWYVSAWWGQYESIYVLPALAAVIAASRGRNGLAAALLAVSLATKPQAIPFILPFVAWCWAKGGWREVARAGVIGAATLVVLWLPFVAAGGPLHYLENLTYYQSEVFNVLSARAWNPWSLLQEAAAGGRFIADDNPIIGPITFRHLGYAITGFLSLAIMAAIIRNPTPRTLVLAMTASVLVFFVVMTQMHERYSYAALILPILLLNEPRIRAWWLVLSAVASINLISAIPLTTSIGALLPPTGLLAIVGAIVFTGLTIWLLIELLRSTAQRPASEP